jgi:hypothetical protein
MPQFHCSQPGFAKYTPNLFFLICLSVSSAIVLPSTISALHHYKTKQTGMAEMLDSSSGVLPSGSRSTRRLSECLCGFHFTRYLLDANSYKYQYAEQSQLLRKSSVHTSQEDASLLSYKDEPMRTPSREMTAAYGKNKMYHVGRVPSF